MTTWNDKPDNPDNPDGPEYPDAPSQPSRGDRLGRADGPECPSASARRADDSERPSVDRAANRASASARRPSWERPSRERSSQERPERPERRYPSPVSPTKDRREIYATVFALIMGLGFLVGYAFRPFTSAQGGVPGKVARVASDASVDNGRAVARELISDGAANFLWAAHWLSAALLLAVLVCTAMLCLNFLRGDFFTVGSYRWITAMSWVLFVYLLVPGFVGMLGGNMVLRDLGLHWMSIPAIDTDDFIVMYVLVMTLSLVAVAIRRAAVLERDTEGLV